MEKSIITLISKDSNILEESELGLFGIYKKISKAFDI
jgi:hypothetical protein